jgi:protein-S-isoprenylcysteine O-methyltransferase Ste14
MRWVVFVLLLLGAHWSLTAFVPAPAGSAGWLWPFAADARPLVDRVGGLPGQPGGAVTAALAGIAGACFVAAVVGLFWKAVPTPWWPRLVLAAVAASLPLHLLWFGTWRIAPILNDAALLWGVLTRRWTAEVLPVRGLDQGSGRIHPLMNVPVPWTYVLSYLVGVGGELLLPLPARSAATTRILWIAGIGLAALGGLVAFLSLGIFRAARTTTVPFETPSTLVTRGPYRFTRNPMYVGLALLYLGVAGTRAEAWPVLCLPLLILYLDRVVIPAEETRLRHAFGDAYERYRARVRRWI